MDYKLSDAINDPRVEHTFSPNIIYNEMHHPLSNSIVGPVRTKVHVVTDVMLDAVMQAV